MSSTDTGTNRPSRRRQSRELALKVLYGYEAGGSDPFQGLDYFRQEEDADRESDSFAAELVEGVLAHWSDLDLEIRRLAHTWDLQRIAFVDRNLLRLALFELRWRPDIPVSVSISEAVELAKIYGGTDSGRFVNGILGQSAREMDADDAPPEQPLQPLQPNGTAAPGSREDSH